MRPSRLRAIHLPRCDELSYRIVELSNGLRAVLVSDPTTDKAAAALDVRVGSMLDPPGEAPSSTLLPVLHNAQQRPSSHEADVRAARP